MKKNGAPFLTKVVQRYWKGMQTQGRGTKTLAETRQYGENIFIPEGMERLRLQP
ncbi:MAG: hypothetical protein KJ804_08760 [Proteobacteria bacterium]|nr:hypothetical protein [Pseudomonadota bacterium]